MYRLAPGVLHYALPPDGSEKTDSLEQQQQRNGGETLKKKRRTTIENTQSMVRSAGKTPSAPDDDGGVAVLDSDSSKYVCAIDGAIPPGMLQMMQVGVLPWISVWIRVSEPSIIRRQL